MSPRSILIALGAGAVLSAAVLFLAFPALRQDPAYHAFADRRGLLGLPNAADVLSNLAFLAAGIAGLVRLRCGAPLDAPRAPWAVFFACAALAAFGSAWYHLAPDDQRLVLDRLPMAPGFLALCAALIGERVNARGGRLLLAPLILLGVLSVLCWKIGLDGGAGDLRFYGLVQFYPALALPFVILATRRERAARDALLWAALGSYALAKLCEAGDAWIFARGGIVSGHTLKHLAAGAAVLLLALRMGQRRGALLDASILSAA